MLLQADSGDIKFQKYTMLLKPQSNRIRIFAMSMRNLNCYKIFAMLFWLLLSETTAILANDTSAIQNILKKAASAKSNDDRTSAFINVSEIYAGTDLVKAAIYAKKALKSAELSSGNRIKESAFSNAINILAAAGNYEQAVHYMTLSMELSRKSGDKEAIAKSTFNLGSGWLILGNYARAEKLFEDAYHLACQVSGSYLFLDTATHLLYLNNMGMIASETNTLNEAKDYYLQGINQSKNNPALWAEYARFLINYGDLQLKSKDPAEAKNSYRKALLAEKTTWICLRIFHQPLPAGI